MKEQIQKPKDASRVIQREAKAANQTGWQQVLQKYAPKTVQRESLPDEEDLLQGKFEKTAQLETLPDEDEELIQGKFEPNRTGLPDNLKTGIENLSGYSMNDVRVHYNSPKPAQLQALAYTQGTDIHVAPGQEKHLPHEAWHVVQQMQGRVQPTVQLQGVNVNDDAGLEREADVMGGKVLQRKKLHDGFDTRNKGFQAVSDLLKELRPKAIAASDDKTHTSHGSSKEKYHDIAKSHEDALIKMYEQAKAAPMREIDKKIKKSTNLSEIAQLRKENMSIQLRGDRHYWYRTNECAVWIYAGCFKNHTEANKWFHINRERLGIINFGQGGKTKYK